MRQRGNKALRNVRANGEHRRRRTVICLPDELAGPPEGHRGNARTTVSGTNGGMLMGMSCRDRRGVAGDVDAAQRSGEDKERSERA